MQRKGWITLATIVVAAGVVAGGTAAVAADLRLETSSGRVVPGGAVVGAKTEPVVSQTPADGGAGTGATAPPAGDTAPPAGDTANGGVTVAPVPPAVVVPPSSDDSDDDYDDDYDDGGDDDGGDDGGDDD